MNRRNLLLATSGALVCAASGLNAGALLGPAESSTGSGFGNACALIPVQRVRQGNAGLHEISLKRFFPRQVDGPDLLEHFALDLQFLDDLARPHTVYAWQLVRRLSATWSGGFRMGLPSHQVNLLAHLRQRGARTTESWSGRPLLGYESILTTARSSTGKVPLAPDLRLDAATMELSLADGSPRDFDALLLSAV